MEKPFTSNNIIIHCLGKNIKHYLDEKRVWTFIIGSEEEKQGIAKAPNHSQKKIQMALEIQFLIIYSK